jgi:hypothetical protein
MKKLLLVAGVLLSIPSFAQEEKRSVGELHGNVQFDGQFYRRDVAIDSTGEFYPDERFLGQGYANFVYSQGPFRAGIRYENYQNVMLGFPPGYRGEGITYRFVQFTQDKLDITVGNFYEQFGMGMALRAYEERGLGYDNMFDGMRLIYQPIQGVRLKGLIGRQRIYFEKSPGIVRALDGEFNLNDLIESMTDSKTKITLGGSFVSKFQEANDPFLNLPENVALGGGRINILRGDFGFSSEYVYKVNDPSADNGYIFRPGQALLTNFSYTSSGFGALLTFKRVDNMGFRSDRDGILIDGLINYLPAISKVHTYALPSLYQYATQINGEMGVQLELNYLVPKGSWLGGRYGANITLNYCDAYSIYKDIIPKTDTLNYVQNGYNTQYFKLGQVKYFQDFNVKWEQKLNRSVKMMLTYFNMEYNQSVLEDGLKDEVMILNPSAAKMVYINAAAAEFLIKLKPKHYLRTELQWLLSEQDRGDMAMLLVEYSVSPHWFFTVQNIYNYGNPVEKDRINYPLGSVVFVTGTTRFQLSYGRQQRGIFCVGGVCRVVPPSNGLSISITSSF